MTMMTRLVTGMSQMTGVMKKTLRPLSLKSPPSLRQSNIYPGPSLYGARACTTQPAGPCTNHPPQPAGAPRSLSLKWLRAQGRPGICNICCYALGCRTCALPEVAHARSRVTPRHLA